MTDPGRQVGSRARGGFPADLVCEGGGVKGPALVGAVQALTDSGYRFRRYAGTSAGAIVASLLAAGWSPADLKSLMTTQDFSQFEDVSPWFAHARDVGEFVGCWLTRASTGETSCMHGSRSSSPHATSTPGET
jgi:predicted acylesterase/phospholipase RssA